MKTRSLLVVLTACACVLVGCTRADKNNNAQNTGAQQTAGEASQTEATALNEALEAYGKAKSESRRLSILTGLKEELDGYVAAGSLTQEQADLILNYYAEQLTLQQNGAGFGRGSRMKNDGTNGANGLGGKGGRGGRGGHGGSGRFGLQQNGTEQGSVPEAPVSPDASGT